uniref:CSON011069 protein n=1 Tax=Culicoides sonorensis TaxID=179676 RepID=A0A336LLM4_CULSO
MMTRTLDQSLTFYLIFYNIYQ